MHIKSHYLKILSNTFVVLLLLVLLVFMRVNWMNYFSIDTVKEVNGGIADLTDIDTTTQFKTKLNGEWLLYPEQFIFANHLTDHSTIQEAVISTVPTDWTHHFSEVDTTLPFGSYRLQITTNNEPNQMYGLFVPESFEAYEVYVNGQLTGGLGDLEGPPTSSPSARPVTVYFSSPTNEIDVVIQGIQANNYKEGGLTKSVIFGDMQSIQSMNHFSQTSQLIVAAILLLYFLYIILLTLIGIREMTLYYFALLAFITTVTILLSHDRILFKYLPHNWISGDKLFFTAYLMAMLLFILYIQTLLTTYIRKNYFIVLNIAFVLYIAFILIVPIQLVYKTLFIFNLFYLILPLLLVIFILTIVFNGRKEIGFLLLMATAVASNSITITLNETSDFSIYYPFDLLIAAIAISAHWFYHHRQTTVRATTLSHQLQTEINQKDDFLANTSHELRNPLHGIMNIAQVLMEQPEDATKQRKNLQLLISIGDYMSFLLNDLLDLSKLQEKRIQLQRRNLSIQATVQGVTDMLRYMLHDKPVELVIDIAEDFPKVFADEKRFMQILFNLIHNAMKFTHDGSITIQATTNNEVAIIQVIDTGIGIEPSFIERVFDRYEQNDKSMTAIGGGLGLGLAICQELVRLHDGDISVTSTVGQGTTFSFTLPLASKQQIDNMNLNDNLAIYPEELADLPWITMKSYPLHNVVSTHMTATIESNRPHVLVVDDDAVNLQVLVQLLESENYLVKTALNGNEALTLLHEKKFDLLITDLMMPEMSGYELIEATRKKWPIVDLPIIVLSARIQREDILSAFYLGANDYVTKPVDAFELRARAQTLISLGQAINDRSRLEAAWLQAQINPHFFFNVLSSIHTLSDINQEKMIALIEAFSDYLQTSFDFDNTSLLVPIDYELNIVRSYLEIEKIRFEERITIVWDIDEDATFLLPPLSMQTIVENAIKHGLLPQIEGGTITISVKAMDNHYLIAIIDDGIGFDLQDNNPLYREGGVGIPNTNLRLKQLFGSGLEVTSILGEGTTVSFKIPKTTI